MSNFSRVFGRYLQDEEIAQTTIATLSGLDDSKISRLANGVSKPSADDLAALSNAVADSADRFRLVFAHIQDEVPAELLRDLQIELKTDALHESPSVPQDLPASVRSALAYLFTMRHELPSIDDVLVSFAGTLGWEAKPPKTTPRKLQAMAQAIEQDELQRLSSSAAQGAKAPPAGATPSPAAPEKPPASNRRPKKSQSPSTRYPSHEE